MVDIFSQILHYFQLIFDYYLQIFVVIFIIFERCVCFLHFFNDFGRCLIDFHVFMILDCFFVSFGLFVLILADVWRMFGQGFWH